MTEKIDLTTDHKLLDDDLACGKPRNPLRGIIALWAGFLWLLVRMVAVLVPMALLALLAAFLASGLWGHAGFTITLTVMAIVALPIWLVPALWFFFPAYFDLVRLSGLFLQKISGLQPKDTIGVVNARWQDLHSDGRRWWRCWLARS